MIFQFQLYETLRNILKTMILYRGRIICITSARDDDSIRSLAEIALNTLLQQNKKASLAQSQPSQSASEGATQNEE